MHSPIPLPLIQTRFVLVSCRNSRHETGGFVPGFTLREDHPAAHGVEEQNAQFRPVSQAFAVDAFFLISALPACR
jgi:hypothetical protein